MRQQVAKLWPVVFVGGCSLIYNPTNIGKASDAAIDAPPDAPPADADPTMLMIEDVAPNVILEGQGEGGSRKALLVIRGHHIVSDGLAVSISPDTGLTLGAPTVAANGDFIAVEVTAAITATAMGSTPLTITVQQTGGPEGGVQLAGKLDLIHLPEFPAGTAFATASLAPLYSKVETASNVTFSGSPLQPALIRAVSSITIGNINVSGAPAGTGNSFGAGGAGGCAGGGDGATGGCAQTDGGGGGAGGTPGGGAGGGFSGPGGSGNGAGGGTAGTAHGNAQLVNYVGAPGTANQSSGGGGGGAETLSNAGAGGGGGGTIELTAGGDITVGAITANGGKGGNATTLITGAGGGGGGSGGVVVLRSDAGAITADSISATGGAAGSGAGTGGGGGMGAPGRVRVDLATGTLPAATPASRRGPAFSATTLTIVNTASPMLTLSGTNNDVVDSFILDADDTPHFDQPMEQTFVNGALVLAPTLLPGYNRFCITLRPGMRGDALADKCIDLAYLP